MKYQSFHSSCGYTGLANLLTDYGEDTEDHKIALEMEMPYLFRHNPNRRGYLAGAMLTGPKWFNLFLHPHGFTYSEQHVEYSGVPSYLARLNEKALVPLLIHKEGYPHYTVFINSDGNNYRFLNSKYADSTEPDFLVFSQGELLSRLEPPCVIGTLRRTKPTVLNIISELRGTLLVLDHYQDHIQRYWTSTQSTPLNSYQLHWVFEPFLEDLPAVLMLVGHEDLSQRMRAKNIKIRKLLTEERSFSLSGSISLDRCLTLIEDYRKLVKERISQLVSNSAPML